MKKTDSQNWNHEATPLDTLFSERVFSFFERQLRLAEAVGDLDWQLRPEDEMLDFGEYITESSFKPERSFRVQLIGTESYISDTWRWGWTRSASPSSFAHRSHKLLEMGRSAGMEELTADEIELNGFAQPTGDEIAAIGAAILDLPLYRCTHENGAVWVGLTDFHPQQTKLSLSDVLSIIKEGITRYVIKDQPHAVLSYAEQLGLSTRIEFPNIWLSSPEGNIEIVMDQDGWIQTAHLRSLR